MIEIAIDDEIGFWGITAAFVSSKLEGIVNGEEIKLSINSPGGSVFQSIAIFNIIRDHAKNHPVSVYITGVAASGASYIALAARTVTPESKVYVSDNSIFVIHNPYVIIQGDYKQLLKEADWLKRLAFVMASTYAFVSKQKQDDIQAAMDEEAFYIGQEIIDSGFANYFEKVNPEENADPQNNREALIVNAKTAIQNVKVKIAEKEPPIDEKAVALLGETFNSGDGMGAGPGTETVLETTETHPDPQNKSEPDGKESPSGKGETMNKEELKAKYPEVYAAIFGEGKEAGRKEERERTVAHLKLGETSGSLETAAKYIRDGSSVTSEEVQSEYLSLRMNKQALASRTADNPGSVTTGGEEVEDDAKAMAIFESAYAGKEYKGGKK
jgi:ATP-dependent protease ClpP protease subunit